MSLQRGSIADWQALEVGLARRSLVRACRSGWMQIGRHVFVDRDGDLTDAQLRIIGVLETGPGAVLAGRAALVEAGWTGGDRGMVDVLAPRSHRGRSRSALPWLRVRVPHELPPRTGNIPRTTAARAAVDAASWAASSREAMMILTSTVQQGLVAPAHLEREIASRQRLRNRRWIREALDAITEGATSSNEARFLRECRRRGLPKPRMQVRRIDAQGSRRRTDAEFRTPDGRLVIVEIDGVGHFEVEQWHADLVRNNALTVQTGAMRLHVTGWQISNDPDPFFDLLADLVLGPVRKSTIGWLVS